MGAPLGARDRVHLVEDHRLDPGQRLTGRGRQHQEEGLGGGDQDVRRPCRHGAALGGRGVARADAHPHLGLGQSEAHRLLADTGQWRAEIALHVDGEGLERRHVQHSAALLRLGGRRDRRQLVEGGEEGGQGLARSGRGDDQDVRPFADRPPGALLRGRRRAEGPREPAAGRGGERIDSGAGHVPHRAPRH